MDTTRQCRQASAIAILTALALCGSGCGGGAGGGTPGGSGGTASAAAVLEYSVRAVTNFIKVPLARQATAYTCGPTALQSVLYHYGQELRQDLLAAALKSDPNTGTSYIEIVNFAQSLGFEVAVYFDLTADELRKFIDAGQPVIVAIQAWPATAVDWTTDWNDGHYAVAVGYDQDNFYFMDPYTLGNYTFIPTAEFLNRWHDMAGSMRVNHLAIVVSKSSVARYDSDKIKRMN